MEAAFADRRTTALAVVDGRFTKQGALPTGKMARSVPLLDVLIVGRFKMLPVESR
jgi:hypothetical protein